MNKTERFFQTTTLSIGAYLCNLLRLLNKSITEYKQAALSLMKLIS